MDYSQLEEVKAGEKADTKITEVNEGKQQEFRSEKYFENIDDTPEKVKKIKDSACIQVLTDNGAELVINLPVNNRVSPKSKLAMYKKTYGDYPKVNQKVSTKTDDNGFFRIILEAS